MDIITIPSPLRPTWHEQSLERAPALRQYIPKQALHQIVILYMMYTQDSQVFNVKCIQA